MDRSNMSAEMQNMLIGQLSEKINALESVMPNNLDYVLNMEQDTGKKWVDGSPIYQNTFAMSSPGTGDIVMLHGIDGLDIITSGAVGYCDLDDNTRITLPVINHASSGGGGGSGGSANDAKNTITIVSWDKLELLGYIGTNYVGGLAVAHLVFTIEYTKEA